jgi:hypothetical protein
MSVPRSRLLSILCATATLGLLTLGAPQVASAAVASTAGQTSHDRVGYGSAPGNDPSLQALSPSGCVQYADHPHESSTTPGRVNGKVRAVCNLTVPKMSHSAQLWETRWWGWDRIGINQRYSHLWSKFGRAIANDWCKNNTVRVTGNGYIIDRDSKTYYASTISASIKNPCSF